MHQESPWDGSRGSDPLDVVVYFGDRLPSKGPGSTPFLWSQTIAVGPAVESRERGREGEAIGSRVAHDAACRLLRQRYGECTSFLQKSQQKESAKKLKREQQHLQQQTTSLKEAHHESPRPSQSALSSSTSIAHRSSDTTPRSSFLLSSALRKDVVPLAVKQDQSAAAVRQLMTEGVWGEHAATTKEGLPHSSSFSHHRSTSPTISNEEHATDRVVVEATTTRPASGALVRRNVRTALPQQRGPHRFLKEGSTSSSPIRRPHSAALTDVSVEADAVETSQQLPPRPASASNGGPRSSSLYFIIPTEQQQQQERSSSSSRPNFSSLTAPTTTGWSSAIQDSPALSIMKLYQRRQRDQRRRSTQLMNSSGRRASVDSVNAAAARRRSSAATTMSGGVGALDEVAGESGGVGLRSSGHSTTTATIDDASKLLSQRAEDSYPSAEQCRNLRASVALARSAIVSDWVDHMYDKEAMSKKIRSGPVALEKPKDTSQATATIAVMQAQAGQPTIVHTLRSVNAQQWAQLDERDRRNRTRSGTVRRLRDDVADAVELRESLAAMQTEFIRKDMERKMDSFAKPKTSNASSSSLTQTQGGPGKRAALTRHVEETPLNAAELHGLLLKRRQFFADRHRRLHGSSQDAAADVVSDEEGGKGARKYSRSVGGAKRKAAMEGQASSSSMARSNGGTNGDGSGAVSSIPIQSTIVLNGETFVYSELFRH